MQKIWLDSGNLYDGSQLRSHFAYMNHGVLGNSILSWVGGCDVGFEHMVDGEDLLQQSSIKADKMLHFIVEVFSFDLMATACFQRIMSSTLCEMVQHRLIEQKSSQKVFRKGDDIYIGNAKMNVSVASRSPVSGMIHFGINVLNTGTPVETYSLSDVNWPAAEFATEYCSRVCQEYEQLVRATQKVLPLN